ncbi:dehydrogenase/reductase SDR family member 9-like [Oculina patagonica]
MASTIVILCFVAATCYILRWIFLYFRGGQDKIEGITNKYVLITGSGSGFGKEIAVELDQLGFRVIATCRTKTGEDSVRAVCSDRVKTYCMDVTDANQVQEVYESIKKEIPADEGLWGLVNNAGKLTVGMVEWQPLDSFKSIADVNLWGMIFVTQTFLPLVKKARGRIVNMGSILGRIALPYLHAYTISKYGVAAFSDALRREIHSWGVHVSIIEAGAHKTKLVSGDLLAEQLQSQWNGLSEQLKQEYGGDEGLQRGLKKMKLFDTVTSARTDKVVSSVVHALTSRNPRTHYVIGLDAKVMVWLAMMPSCITDFLFRIMAVINPGPGPRRNVSHEFTNSS